MAGILVQHKVKDFENWKKAYDSHSPMRTSGGELSGQVFRSANDPNHVVVFSKWNTLEKAQQFAQSPDLKAAMEQAGVEGIPTITFLNEA